ncbi:hypothetical protein [Pedobacter chinensis]|nr:hypothetical protein [Pedobacter chinensis]
MENWEQLSIGTILKTKKKYYEVVNTFASGNYTIRAIECEHKMGIDDRVIHLGLQDGTWEIIK